MKKFPKIIDNKRINLLDTLVEASVNFDEISIATGYWDLEATKLLLPHLANYKKIRLLIGREPLIILWNKFMKIYRATLKEPIVFPGSIIITTENLDSINFDKIIYCEVSPIGAMGNEGGIIIYLLKDENTLVTYETNIKTDPQTFDTVSSLINQNIDYFIEYSGGFGNYVYVKKDAQLEIDEKYNCFWYQSQNTKLRIDSSVQGVFDTAVAEMRV